MPAKGRPAAGVPAGVVESFTVHLPSRGWTAPGRTVWTPGRPGAHLVAPLSDAFEVECRLRQARHGQLAVALGALDPDGPPPELAGRQQRRARPGEWIEDELAGPR